MLALWVSPFTVLSFAEATSGASYSIEAYRNFAELVGCVKLYTSVLRIDEISLYSEPEYRVPSSIPQVCLGGGGGLPRVGQI